MDNSNFINQESQKSSLIKFSEQKKKKKEEKKPTTSLSTWGMKKVPKLDCHCRV